ncbi:MAG: ribonuclease HI [Clostridia bacterium]|nr:ribonuclease HI [Clostridia bacterium]
MRKQVEIYTDGSCLNNPGPGGWGAILCWNGVEKELSGGDANTTNNRMELTAAIMALRALKQPCDVIMTSDSKYLCDGMSKGWAASWKRKGWKRADNSPAQNPELWDELLNLCSLHSVKFVWVKGHAGHPYNERCDEMAQARAREYQA